MKILILFNLLGIITCMVVYQNPFYKTFKKNFDKTENESKVYKNNHDKMNSKIKNAQNLFMCIGENCYSIQEFRILPENTFSCHEKNILIDILTLKKFNQTENDGIYGFLTQSRTIVHDQEISDICKKIKRLTFIFKYYSL